MPEQLLQTSYRVPRVSLKTQHLSGFDVMVDVVRELQQQGFFGAGIPRSHEEQIIATGAATVIQICHKAWGLPGGDFPPEVSDALYAQTVVESCRTIMDKVRERQNDAA